ncbi:dolichol phosphate mannose synthase, putative [Perkinsus marinus ATCC 50983]|uniref:Dolichol-phosphate mannosyltransferase subunit 1 n=1 Tax=Perkinsus marinus (strain ATCC 50983 / TXsc) TaxID=423536 RepID=C5KL61_PERM5|nr:dolichol phosphate mannose synthase, putative [Perkinsus marinus ATCC 50983]EER14734.1 dolichol phosphate mannose synthase, putative [Perkinsus marinus ATCC 50983]|eukprot:XP_002782938.1 dolichol phosphate mannose synthase, putative [Perkinsus marinus ATCC 50983]
MAPMRKELSVVVPTYNEVENVRPLCERLFKACREAGLTIELLLMDDESAGSDETRKIVNVLSNEGYTIRMHCRKAEEGRGLSSAVLLGFAMAKYDTMVCMDADLQHEPESVPAVADPVLRGEAEFTVGSRYCRDGGIGFQWSLIRRIISEGATLLAIGVAKSSDPMSGFFCTTKEVFNRGHNKCNPIGFKIGLELMVRCNANPVVDVPITFQERVAGESKLTMKQNVQYVEQLASLYFEKYFLFILLLPLLIVFALAYWKGSIQW